MKTLHQSLIDYEITMLKAIADCRAVPLDTTDHVEAVHQLADVLLSPVDTAIVLDDLSPEEKEALQFLLEYGGQVEEARFARQYGAIRLMGSARLERERPWENPANAAEGLWYRGLIFKAFQVTGQGSQETVYIPNDLFPLLQPNLPQSQTPATFKLGQATVPKVVISGSGRLRENFFRILVYLQTTPVRMQTNDALLPKDKQALIQNLLPPVSPSVDSSAELEFLLHLGQQAKLLIIAHGRLRPDRDAARGWLQASYTQQIRRLQDTWRADHTWNDLWHVPKLIPQPTGWENSPLLARSKILGYLEQVEGAGSEWHSIDEFISTVKRIDADFQRPTGDYESWYIQDIRGNFLMGFEHWDQVEGALIRYLLTHILLLLGVVELGCPVESADPTSFRLTPLGHAFLTGQRSDVEVEGRRPVFLRMDNNFHVQVPDQASLYDRFQLARFAQLDRYTGTRALYKISQASVGRALRNGVTTEQIIAFLTRATNNQTALKVIETIRTWGSRYATIRLEQAAILRLEHEGLLKELRQQPALNRLLGEVLNPTTVLVSADNIQELRRLLIELGYLE